MMLSPKEPIPNVTIQAQIEVLEALAAVDAELKELTDALTQEREGLRSKQDQLSSLDERFDRSKKSVEDMEKMRNDLHTELRQMAVQIERSREKLSRCRTEREANAVQRELEELRKLYRDREQEIERLEGLIGQGRDEGGKLSTDRNRISGELGASEGDVMGRLQSSEARLTEKMALRNGLVPKLEVALYRRYEMIRKRKGSAIAHTSAGTCSACHMQLQPMLFQQLLRADAFSQCPSCNRILYFRLAKPGESDDSTENA